MGLRGRPKSGRTLANGSDHKYAKSLLWSGAMTKHDALALGPRVQTFTFADVSFDLHVLHSGSTASI